MPRPTSSSSAKKSAKPFSALTAAWKERKAERENEIAKMVIDAAAGAETKLINTLESIDFRKSKLPEQALNRSSEEGREMGDLEYSKHIFIKKLKETISTTQVDLRAIDTQLLVLAEKFKYAVEKGDLNAAQAAKVGLAMGILKIRDRVPSNLPDQMTDYVERSAEYLAHWVTEVDLSSAVDQTERQVAAFQKTLDDKKDQLDAMKSNLELRIQESASFARAFGQITRNEVSENRLDWTPEQMEAHKLLVDMNYTKDALAAARQDLNYKDSELTINRQRVEDLQGKLNIEPDRDLDSLLNQYKEIMDSWMKELAKIDVSIAEFEKQRLYYKGQREQMEYGEGAVAQRDSAYRAANEFINERARVQREEQKEHEAGKIDNWELAGGISDKQHEENLKAIDKERAEREAQQRQATKQRIRE